METATAATQWLPDRPRTDSAKVIETEWLPMTRFHGMSRQLHYRWSHLEFIMLAKTDAFAALSPWAAHQGHCRIRNFRVSDMPSAWMEAYQNWLAADIQSYQRRSKRALEAFLVMTLLMEVPFLSI